MRVVLYCYSGTGNTKWACESLARELRALGDSVDIFPISANYPPPPPNGYDKVVIGYPVHAFNAPKPVLRFLKKLNPSSRHLPVWLVRTSGEPLKLNDASAILPARILGERGYIVKGEFHYVMPYNIIFRHSDEMTVRMKRAAELAIPHDARAVFEGEGVRTHVGPLRRFVSFALRIEHAAMPFLGRRFRPTPKCIGCGLCARNCPEGNIRMENGTPKFGKSCAGCMACAFSCPQDAIKISLLNGWRVNGAYTFEGRAASDEEICRYCRKSYLRYFHSVEDAYSRQPDLPTDLIRGYPQEE